jgi:hypothetical protein
LQQASREYGPPYTSLRDLVIRGHLPGVRLGDGRRIWVRRADLEQLVERSTQTEDAVKLAYRRTGREYRKRLGLPLTVVHASELLADVIETDRMFADDPKVVRLREWFKSVAAKHQIDVRADAAPQLRNGSAVRKLRRVTIAPIQSLETAAVAAHELGHVLGDMDANARSKAGEFGLGRICPSDEIDAWKWVLANIPVWERAMHARMTECLASYRPDASPREAQLMDELCLNVTLRRTQLRISGSGTK